MEYIKALKRKKAGYILLVVYLVIGIFIFNNYGISTDERVERRTSLVSYKHILSELEMLENASENVQEALKNTPEISTYRDRLYGVAFQLPTVFIEHLFDFKLDSRTIYLIRHFYNFLNYLLGCLCFYLILWKRFSRTYVPFLGLLMLILLPRFFAESFYNNKDMAFASWYIISIYCALKFLETKTIKNLLLFSFVVTFATNIRILGISILLLTLAFCIVQAFCDRTKVKEISKLIILSLASALLFYILITPASWTSNPFLFIKDVFVKFSDYSSWNNKHYYMGEWITRYVPWHYIPVWIIITTPLMYIFLFVMGSKNYYSTLKYYVVSNSNVLQTSSSLETPDDTDDNNLVSKDIENVSTSNKQSLTQFTANHLNKFLSNNIHLYDTFLFLAFWCSLMGYIGLRISMYEGLRHAWFILFPFMYLAALGLYYLFQTFINNSFKQKIVLGSLIISMSHTGLWMISNHPYQYVYFNFLFRDYGFENFTRDYWRVSSMDMYKYIYKIDQREKITASGGNFNSTMAIMPKDIRSKFSNYDFKYGADYIICQPTSWGVDKEPKYSGYKEFYNISIGGHKIGIAYKYLIDNNVFVKDMNIKKITSSENVKRVNRMTDNKLNTYWNSGRPQAVGDTITIEFNETVNYNILRLYIGSYVNDYPRKLQVYTSMDGQNWEEVKFIWNNRVDYIINEKKYRFLKLENNKEDDERWWTIRELNLGTIDKNIIDEILMSK